jgi:hypothetical protein
MMLCSVALAETPATQPATRPATTLPADSPIRAWFTSLASPDGTQRDEAETRLMGLTRDDLPGLRALVEQSRPLAPAQVAALHDIVVQVYLSGEPYVSDSNGGFLGLRWVNDPIRLEEAPGIGVPVDVRLIGFPSFQMLREGDLILGVLVQPKQPLQQLPNMATPTLPLLQAAISQAGANRQVILEVLRQGQTIRVPLRLMPRPKLQESPDVIESFSTERKQKGEAYWAKEFLPLLRPGVS